MTKRAEHTIQCAFFEWAGYAKAEHPELKLLFAIPNGGHRYKAVAGKIKAEGVKRGVPDVCLPVPRGGYNALWIEFKTPTGRLTEVQQGWRQRLEQCGGCYHVCRSAGEAIDRVRAYLGGEAEEVTG